MSTGNIITLAGLGIILTVLSMILLYKQWTKLSQDNIKMPKWMKIYSIIILLSLIAIILIRQSVYEDTDVCDVARDMMIVSLLWVAAAIDKKFYKIPNGIIITGIVYWIAATIYDLFTQSEVCLGNVISELIAVAIIILVVGICLLLMKNSIGMGDLKLLLLVAAFFGLADVAFGCICRIPGIPDKKDQNQTGCDPVCTIYVNRNYAGNYIDRYIRGRNE